MQLNVSHTNATCIFDTNGTATVQVSNATPPYNYQWSTGQTTQTTTGLTPNFYYSVYVVDANGCESNYYPIHVNYNNLSCAALVEGEVVNDWDKDCALTTGDEGIPNINVQAIPGYYDFTDANGNFVLDAVPQGNIEIMFSKLGYSQTSQILNIEKSEIPLICFTNNLGWFEVKWKLI